MKKLTALVLVLCIMLSAFALTACDEKPTSGGNAGGGNNNQTSNNTGNSENSGTTEGSVYDIVSAAMAKTLQAKSYEVKLDTLKKTDLMGYKYEDTIQGNLKATALDTAKPEAYFSGKATVQGYDFEQDYYYDGEWKYFDMSEDGGYKSKVSYEEFADEMGAPETVMVTLPEALFANAESKKNDDGSLTVTLTVDEATMETLYKDAITAVVYDVVGNDLNQATTKDAVIVVTVADGYIKDYKVSFVCEISAGSDKVTYDVSDAVTYVSCDQAVTITPPANLDNFYELDWG